MGIFIPGLGINEGNGNGVTEITWNDLTAITEFQSLVDGVAANSLAIASHDHDNQYKNINWLPGWNDLTAVL